jgi:hypothetical protein
MMIRKLLVGISVLLLASCSGMEQKPQPPPIDAVLAGLTEQNGRACIRVNDIHGFAALSDQLISVNSRRGEYFLVTMPYRCYSLSSTYEIAFKGSYLDVCGGGARDAILTPDESCPIKHIFKFKSRKDALATLELARKKQEAMALPPFQGK